MHPEHWVPILWPCGPLDLALAETPGEFEAAALSSWQNPETLTILGQSPINCVVVNLAAGRPEDAQQLEVLKPIASKARDLGLAVVGRVAGSSTASAISAAQVLRLEAVLTDKPAEVQAPMAFPAVRMGAIDPGSSPVFALTETEWPSVRVQQRGSAESGPTGAPWINSNGWRIRLAQSKAPGRQVWVLADPPKDLVMPRRTHAYAVAIADAAAYGARWVVSLDAELRQGMTNRELAAMERWNGVMAALSASERLRMPPGPQQALARLGVLSDFAGENEFMSHEMLNLSSRRHLAYRVLPKETSKASDLLGLQGVIFMDAGAPEGRWASALVTFVEQGGLLILPHSAAGYAAANFKAAGEHESGYKLFQRQKGTVAVAAEDWGDPYLVAAEAHRLLSRREDVYRAWNPGASSIYVERLSPDRVRAHIINYTGNQTSDLMALYVAGKYKTAKWSNLFGVTAEPLKLEQRPDGAEVKLPPFAAYAAVEFVS